MLMSPGEAAHWAMHLGRLEERSDLYLAFLKFDVSKPYNIRILSAYARSVRRFEYLKKKDRAYYYKRRPLPIEDPTHSNEPIHTLIQREFLDSCRAAPKLTGLIRAALIHEDPGKIMGSNDPRYFAKAVYQAHKDASIHSTDYQPRPYSRKVRGKEQSC